MRPLPETGFLRQRDILGDPKAEPPIAPLIPVSKSTWWSWIAAGKAPRPVKLGPHTTAWRIADIREFIAAHDAGRPA
ncbi:MAG: helix-turn-helix transcriptional regulator [Vulcanimicrobiaceae bacterium]|jgi:predicted DNA-binding transcriptional regulator AlpA|nr:AlpA family phage regulatory protein [Betaproteobacteria bacterium]